MKKILVFIATVSSLMFAKSEMETCKKCHPIIVEEFQNSMHKKSSFYDDKIHSAVWDRHPSKEKGDYSCAKCHAPHGKTEEEIKKGISCSTCHTIQNIEHHEQSNSNIYSKDPKTFFSAEKGKETQKVTYKQERSFFGMNKTTVGSPYHDIDYTNENFYTGQVCMGCHSHRQNSQEFTLCKIEESGVKDRENNCITCHMPKIKGSATTIRKTQKHAFHGFAGARHKPQMLSEYIELNFEKTVTGFNILVKNKAPHDLLTHPLRAIELRVNLTRDGNTTALKTNSFIKAIGRDGKPSMPWLANAIIVDTMIKANEKRIVNYKNPVKNGDKLEVQIGYYVVNPGALKQLNLDGEKELKKFTVLKQKYFTVE
ncbi:MAG TPA: hypothetical protein CFH81_09510 [Sulfurovum sp. UBA12169]|nr:MAG TPA: hypothetical protein CFH81_09510 [Sulfurovum sp. UBA12169]